MASSQKLELTGAEGQMLAARLDRPVLEPKAWVLFAHCFSCSKDIKGARMLAGRLVQQGYGVVRFDFTGLGHSEGDFANTNFSSNVQDLVAVGRWMQAELGGPDLLIGHSLGGAAAIVAAHALDAVKAVATIGAPADADHVLEAISEDLAQIETRGEATVRLAGRPFTIKRQFVEDVRGAKVREAASTLGRPLLVLHAPLDQTVSIDNATRLFVAAKHPKSFIGLDGADHLFSRTDDAAFAADMIAGWASAYFDAGRVEEKDAHKAGYDVIVAETGQGGFQNSVLAGPHHLLADEPIPIGQDTGLDPYEFVSAGLAACTSMTLRMYATRKNWPLESVEVRINHSKDHAQDCEHCEDGRKVDIFDKELVLTGPLSPDQRQRLLEIADKCPVHRTLHEPVHVKTQLV